MGMGEPLANLDNLLEALETVVSEDGFGLGTRRVTISTVGLPSKIRRLANEGKQYHLAVSLHAPNDALRSRIVPTNGKTGLASILEAADYFFEKTGRQVTYEYVLLRDINDSAANARELGALLRGRRAHVNLIPFNEVEGLPYCRPSDRSLADFTGELRKSGISVKVRKRKGSEIDAACGQLRRGVETSERPLTRSESEDVAEPSLALRVSSQKALARTPRRASLRLRVSITRSTRVSDPAETVDRRSPYRTIARVGTGVRSWGSIKRKASLPSRGKLGGDQPNQRPACAPGPGYAPDDRRAR